MTVRSNFSACFVSYQTFWNLRRFQRLLEAILKWSFLSFFFVCSIDERLFSEFFVVPHIMTDVFVWMLMKVWSTSMACFSVYIRFRFSLCSRDHFNTLARRSLSFPDSKFPLEVWVSLMFAEDLIHPDISLVCVPGSKDVLAMSWSSYLMRTWIVFFAPCYHAAFTRELGAHITIKTESWKKKRMKWSNTVVLRHPRCFIVISSFISLFCCFC